MRISNVNRISHERLLRVNRVSNMPSRAALRDHQAGYGARGGEPGDPVPVDQARLPDEVPDAGLRPPDAHRPRRAAGAAAQPAHGTDRVSGPPDRHRIGLEIEVEPGQVLVEPAEWDLDDLNAALRDGVARPVRVIRGRVTDEHHDPLSTTLTGCAEDVDEALRLHWMVAESPRALVQPA